MKVATATKSTIVNQLTVQARYIVGFVLLTLFLSGCEGLKSGAFKDAVKQPQVSLEKMAVSGMDLNTVNLLLTLKVNNPNNFTLALAGYDYDVKLNSKSMIKGTTNNGFSVPAKSTSPVTIPLSLPLKDVNDLYKSMGDSRQITYDALVDLRLDAPILNLFKIRTNKSGSIDIPQMPTVTFGEIKIKKLTFTEIELAMDMLVDNPNDFSLELKDVVYQVSLADKPWINGGVDNTIKIPKQKTSKINIPFRMRLSELSGNLIQSLRQGGFNDFSVDASFLVDSEHQAFKNMKVPIQYKP